MAFNPLTPAPVIRAALGAARATIETPDPSPRHGDLLCDPAAPAPTLQMWDENIPGWRIIARLPDLKIHYIDYATTLSFGLLTDFAASHTIIIYDHSTDPGTLSIPNLSPSNLETFPRLVTVKNLTLHATPLTLNLGNPADGAAAPPIPTYNSLTLAWVPAKGEWIII